MGDIAGGCPLVCTHHVTYTVTATGNRMAQPTANLRLNQACSNVVVKA